MARGSTDKEGWLELIKNQVVDRRNLNHQPVFDFKIVRVDLLTNCFQLKKFGGRGGGDIIPPHMNSGGLKPH